MNLVEKTKEYNVYRMGATTCVVRKYSRPIVDEPFCKIAKGSLKGDFKNNPKLTKPYSYPLTAAKAFFREIERKKIQVF